MHKNFVEGFDCWVYPPP